MKKRLHFWLITFLLVLMSQAGPVAYAQNPQTIEVGPHFGATSYIGELNTWRNLQDWDWKSLNQFHYDLGAVVRYNYDSRWAFRLDYTYGTFRARDEVAAWRPEAKLNFRSTLHDISLMAEFNFLNYYTGRPESSISPYIFAGVSGFFYKTYPFTGDQAIDTLLLNNLPTDWCWVDSTFIDGNGDKQVTRVFRGKNLDVPAFGISIPFGVGCKLSLSKHLAATLEWRMHYTFTDYLDDVHGEYSDNHVEILDYDLTDPSGLFSENHQRGNAKTNDWFGMINLSITWKFVIPNNSACKMNIN
ncbi:MAG: hypothetical protein IKU00_04920 [Bacteroidales bacterium]|nr:hypothetical protein [Bacteroidales bacterium]